MAAIKLSNQTSKIFNSVDLTIVQTVACSNKLYDITSNKEICVKSTNMATGSYNPFMYSL